MSRGLSGFLWSCRSYNMALLGSGKMLRGQMSTISGPAAVCSTLLHPQLRDGQASGDPGESKSPLSFFFFFLILLEYG